MFLPGFEPNEKQPFASFDPSPHQDFRTRKE